MEEGEKYVKSLSLLPRDGIDLTAGSLVETHGVRCVHHRGDSESKKKEGEALRRIGYNRLYEATNRHLWPSSTTRGNA